MVFARASNQLPLMIIRHRASGGGLALDMPRIIPERPMREFSSNRAAQFFLTGIESD